MEFNWDKIKKSKTLKWALIIGLPTALVGAYFGVKYIKKKIDEKNTNGKANNNSTVRLRPDGTIDTTGMDYYKITAPYSMDIAGKIYDAINKIPYSFVGEKVIRADGGNQIIVIELLAMPQDSDKIKKILPIVGNNVDISSTTKDALVTSQKEMVCEKKDDIINNINDFYEAAKCLNTKSVLGYDLLVIKDLPNIEKRLTVDEMNKIISYVKIGINNLSETQTSELTNLLKKAYTPIK